MPIATQAAVLTAPRGAVEVRTVEIPDPGPEQVLLRLEACGVCHSDLFVSGLAKLPRTPLTLGHEGIGRVVAVGPGVPDFHVGQRVGLTFLASACGECTYCRTGHERFCPKQKNHGYTADGAMAGYALAEERQLIRVPETLDALHLAPLCCAGWTAYGALRESGLMPGQSVAIVGFGGLGQLALRYAAVRELQTIVVDSNEAKLDLARASGAHAVVPFPDSGRAIQKQFGGVDAAIVFAGVPEAIGQALRSVKRMGKAVLVGLTTDDLPLSITDTVLKGLQIQGSFLGTRNDLETVFELAQSHGIVPAVETHRLEDAPEVLRRLGRGEVRTRAVVSFAA